MIEYYLNPKTNEAFFVESDEGATSFYTRMILRNLNEEKDVIRKQDKEFNYVYLTSITIYLEGIEFHKEKIDEVSQTKPFLDEVKKITNGRAINPKLICIRNIDGKADIFLAFKLS